MLSAYERVSTVHGLKVNKLKMVSPPLEIVASCPVRHAFPVGQRLCFLIIDNTRGTYCEFCIPGTFGNATTSEGCNPCQCNGHGDPEQGLCDMVTGKCFCTDDTIGDYCEKCKPGLKGNPKYVT